MAFDTNEVIREEKEPPKAPTLHSDRYKHSIVDSQYKPSHNLLTQVTGVPRLVEYYRGVYNESEEPRAFQPSDLNTYQSYTRIKNLIIKEQDLNGSYEFRTEQGTSTKTNSAYVLFDLTPVKGDVFITDIGDGNAGIFTVTEQPEILNITADKVYLIQYTFLEILTKDCFEMLNARVVEELVYSKDSVLNGGNAVLSQGLYDVQKDLMKYRFHIAQSILQEFFWEPERTIALMVNDPNYNPDVQTRETYGTYIIYDEELTEFLSGVISPELRGQYPFIENPATGYAGREFGVRGVIDIWEVLKMRDWNLIDRCKRTSFLIDTRKLYNTKYYGNLRSSKFTHLIVSDEENYKFFETRAASSTSLWGGPFNSSSFTDVKYDEDVEIKYFLSDGFYDGNPENEFESLFIEVVRDKIINREKILEQCKTLHTLGYWDRLYRAGILLYFIELSRRVDVGV